MGEPAGIGPELSLDIWRRRAELDIPPFCYLGAADQIGDLDPALPVTRVNDPGDAARSFHEAFPVFDISLAKKTIAGIPDPANAAGVIDAIEQGARLALDGSIRALVTNPIQKANLIEGGFGFIGHTDFLAHLAGAQREQAVMMLAGPNLKVVPLTQHIPLRDVPDAISTGLIIQTAEVILRALAENFSLPRPRLAIAGLNPHAGEQTHLGDEEARLIAPAIEALQESGHDVSGPHPADSLFSAAMRSRYDAVLCMYHDQALIPLKTLDGGRAVNVTLGLPMVRTSPDHGTALDIAGRGKASVDSLVAAIRLADQMSR
ncbi:MAG: 4-hydroxythreonine-4-phosphate dehydrogenase PdxA [Proteobacteria bacterium]|nr:4-hydroxythreonine-4-phosphate dehydrogenase PdxA [Pseudomonadota bacterium]